MLDQILDISIKSVYLMLPAYVANMMPVFVKNFGIFKFLDKPIDLNKKLGKERIFGSHKTFRGFITGIVSAIAVAFFQYHVEIYDLFLSISVVDHSRWILIGFCLGSGAMIGDLVKSFFKRRAGIKPGKKFIPFDQIDYTIGALALMLIFYTPSIQMVIVILLISFVFHIAANHIGYYIGLREVKW